MNGTEEEGYYINLPQNINGKVVNYYYIDTTNLREKETINEIKENNQITEENNQIDEKKIDIDLYTRFTPGEKYTVTSKDSENKNIDIYVNYDSILLEDDTKLYNKILETSSNDTKISIKGYMPIDSEIYVEEIQDLESIENKIEQEKKKNVKISKAFDIKIKSNEQLYEPYEFDKNVKVAIESLENIKQNTKVWHIADDEEITEVKFNDKTESKLEFETNSFSTYAMGEEETGSTWDGTVATSFAGGIGTAASPYQISNGAELAYLASVVNSHTIDQINGGYFTQKYYIQTQDIDLGNVNWTPIGLFEGNTFNINSSFQGNYNGSGYKISNMSLTVTQMYSVKKTYGLFGAIYSASDRAIVYNLSVENASIIISINGTPTRDLTFGIIAGHIGKNSSIINCMAKNSTITLQNTVVLNSAGLLAIGGIVGDASATAGEDNASRAEQTGTSKFKIDNCFSDVDIIMNDSAWADNGTTNKYYQFNIGGIIGRIRAETSFPKNCVYTGMITSKHAFIGPIYGCARYNTSNTGSTYYMDTYAGLNSSRASIGNMENGYFYNYKIVSSGQTNEIGSNYQQELSRIEVRSTISVYSLNATTYMGKVQGVNRGEYTETLEEKLNVFNSYENIGSNYNTWYYNLNSDTYSFSEDNSLVADLYEVSENTYQVQLTGEYSAQDITYKWYINDELQTESSNTIIIQNSISNRNLRIEVYENEIKAATCTIVIPKINLSLNLICQTNTITAQLQTDTEITLNDYEFTWYKEVNDVFEIITGQTASTYSSASLDSSAYKLVAINTDNLEFNLEAIIRFGSVIYVNNTTQTINGTTYEAGSNENDGLTPLTPVQTAERAYELLAGQGRTQTNIIVIMGNYFAVLSDQGMYIKDATITGKYDEINYSGNIKISQYTMLKADTVFKNITLNGNNLDGYLYCQGNNLTIEENVTISNYPRAGTAWALVTNNYPAFNIMGGYLNYNGTGNSPRETCNIIVKSGYYARIIGGNRNESSNSLSYNVLEDAATPFNVRITVDIQSSANPNGYDNNIGLVVGGQTDGSCFVNTELNIVNGKIGRIIGANLGYFTRKTPGYPSDSFFGSITMNISGGTIVDLFGGSLGRNGPSTYCYGKIIINITGGVINSSVYGTGAGGVTGYSEVSTDEYKAYAYNTLMQDLEGNIYRLDESNVEINIGENADIRGNVYGGGFGESAFLATATDIASDGGVLYGDISVNITGGRIAGDVYGGGRGSSKYGETRGNLAQVYGDIDVFITGNTIITGDVFGASEGISGYINMAKVTGNVNLTIDGNNVEIQGSIYGGGSIAKTIGDIEEIINTKTVSNIFGGGDNGDVNGDVLLTIRQAQIQENVFGGGNNASCNNVIINIGTSTPEETNVTIGGNIYGGNNNSAVTLEEAIEDVTINIYKDLETSIYGGCNTRGIILNNTNINIYGADITGNVFGAGYGDEALVGQALGTTANVKIAIDGNSRIINGSIYGGGYGGKVNGSVEIFNQGIVGNIASTNIDSTIYGGGYGQNATVSGNTQITFGRSENGVYSTVAKAKGIFGGGYSGNVNGSAVINVLAGEAKFVYGGGYNGSVFGQNGSTINISSDANNAIKTQVSYVYGSGFGTGAEVTKSVINITNATVLKEVYGAGNGGRISGQGETGTILNINNVIVGDATLEDGNIFGGGRGASATVNATTQVYVSNSTIYGNIYGGGDAGDVFDDTDVIVNGGTNVSKAVYGGGNAANIGTNVTNANTNVSVYNADIGKIQGATLTGGEVFGGGNYGVVYGNTIAEVGSTNSAYQTNIGLQFYAGGRGTTGTITVTGNSNGTIAGINTEVTSYGSIELGAVTGEVNIIFDTYRKVSSSNKYKNMTGINKATNMTLVDSDVYLTGGLTDITNLIVPEDSGIMISEDSEIYGDFTGGGTMYLQNEICLTIDGDITEDSTTTTVILNPELLEEERCYIIRGNRFVPYIKVMGNDYTSGAATISGDSTKYDIYSLNKENSNVSIYNTTSTHFATTGNSNQQGEIYYNLNNEEDLNNYYFDSQKNSYYTVSSNLPIRYYVTDTTDSTKTYIYDSNRQSYYYETNEACDSIYYIETTIRIQNYVTMINRNNEDKIYQSSITNENNTYILQDDAFSVETDTIYTMTKIQTNGVWEFLNSEEFLDVRRSIYLANDETTFAFPVGTNITMIINGNKYTYKVNQNTGTNTFWNTYSTTIGKNVNFGNEIPLIVFEDENGNNYQETNNIQNEVTLTDPLLPSMYEKSEIIKFIVDFSECTNYLAEGSYDMILGLHDLQANGEKDIYKNITSNMIEIENRNYGATLDTVNSTYHTNGTIQLSGTLSLDKLSTFNKRDLGKSVVARVTLLDENENIIKYPLGTIVNINGSQIIPATTSAIGNVINSLTQNSFMQNINISIDMSEVQEIKQLAEGEYTAKIEFFLTKDGVLLGKKANLTREVIFELLNVSGYGIKISPRNINNENEDKLQLVTSNVDELKTVNIQYRRGNLDNNSYIQIKTYKNLTDGGFNYQLLATTLAVTQRISNLSANMTSDLIFDDNLENGTYKIVYELCNGENEVLAKTDINYIVNRE